MADDRFSKALNDPRFRRKKNHSGKVKVDKRFEKMFSDPSFVAPVTIDKYGRQTKASAADDMRRFYRLEEDEETKRDGDVKEEEREEEEEEEERKNKKKKAQNKKVETKKNKPAKASEPVPKLKKPSREIYGEGLESSSDDDDDDDSDDDSDSFDDGDDGDELAAQYSSDEEDSDIDLGDDIWEEEEPELGDESRRFAIQNLDWEKIRAVDLFVLLSSFTPSKGMLKSIVIYPSDFGLRCMAEEATSGPPREIFESKKDKDGSGDEDEAAEEEIFEAADLSEEEDSDYGEVDSDNVIDDNVVDDELRVDCPEGFNSDQLRKYELQRLKYYYAVAEFDSAATALAVHTAVDQREFERSAIRLDCRFVPDEIEFTNPPRETCTQLPAAYNTFKFKTPVLQQTQIELTWDQTDAFRKTLSMKAFEESDIDDEDDWKAYLASSSSEEDDEFADEDPDVKLDRKRLAIRQKYSALLDEALNIRPSSRNFEGDEDDDEQEEDDEEDGGKKKKKKLNKKKIVEEEEEEMGDLEITFTPGLTEKAEQLLANKNSGVSEADKSSWEKHLDRRQNKRKEARQQKKEEEEEREKAQRELIKQSKMETRALRKNKKHGKQSDAAGTEEIDASLYLMAEPQDKHDSETKPKAEKKKKQTGRRRDHATVDDKLNVDYGRFGAVLTHPDFAPDPSHPHYRDTAVMKNIRSERLEVSTKRREASESIPRTISDGPSSSSSSSKSAASSSSSSATSSSKTSTAVSFLANSVKRRIAGVQSTDSNTQVQSVKAALERTRDTVSRSKRADPDSAADTHSSSSSSSSSKKSRRN